MGSLPTERNPPVVGNCAVLDLQPYLAFCVLHLLSGRVDVNTS